MAKITKISYTHKPTNNSIHQFFIYSEGFDPKRETLIFKISYKFYYPAYNVETKRHYLEVPKNDLEFESGKTVSDHKIRLFCYDFQKDATNYVATGSIKVYKSTTSYSVSYWGYCEPVKAAVTSDKPWIDGLTVTAVWGPYQDDQPVKKIDLSKPVKYVAITSKEGLSQAQLLAVQWKYSINGGEKANFSTKIEWSSDGHSNRAVMQFTPIKEWNGKNIAVYAFYKGASEEVVQKCYGYYVKPKPTTTTPAKPAAASDSQQPTNKEEIDQYLKNDKNNCGQKYCIKQGNSELIREINIRLSGFGGNVPTDSFTDRTEKMIKQFQRDYMGVYETGRICGDLLIAIDDFQAKYPVDINQGKCPCGGCSGFGNGKYPEEKNNAKIAEKSRKYEYPGMHRSLLWVQRAICFYLETHMKDEKLRFGVLFSGYRCNINNKKNNRTTTNHMGKASDIHIYSLTGKTTTEANCDKVRDLLMKYSGAKLRWEGHDFFALEPSTRNRKGKEFIATNWVHYDVRTFEMKYLDDKFFAKTNEAVNGISMVQLAKNMGLQNLCSCSSQKKASKGDRIMPTKLKTSQKGIDFILDWESYVQFADDDAEGYCTIGYGHLIRKNHCKDIIIPDRFNSGLTKDQARKLFESDLKTIEAAVHRDIKVPLYQHEFDALVSLVFNTGPEFLNIGGANKGETKIKKYINSKKYSEGADEFKDVTNGGLAGLVKRRQREVKMFKFNVYDSKH